MFQSISHDMKVQRLNGISDQSIRMPLYNNETTLEAEPQIDRCYLKHSCKLTEKSKNSLLHTSVLQEKQTWQALRIAFVLTFIIFKRHKNESEKIKNRQMFWMKKMYKIHLLLKGRLQTAYTNTNNQITRFMFMFSCTLQRYCTILESNSTRKAEVDKSGIRGQRSIKQI